MLILSRKSIHSERNCSTVNIPFLECTLQQFFSHFFYWLKWCINYLRMIFKNYYVEKELINNFFSLFSETPLRALKRLKRPLITPVEIMTLCWLWRSVKYWSNPKQKLTIGPTSIQRWILTSDCRNPTIGGQSKC